eukprot:gb/GECH01007588.1/.p1 GENE.gb/GECH01007588.1/~~gb/GECH01007588.1/.p1  ORF type:complete len:117 (+),score=33.34 gb/GECH01007588.1/:1-351(+)
MGRRKSRKPPPKKKMEKVPTVFDCPLCSNTKSVECKIQRKDGFATVQCSVCGGHYISHTITALTEPIDVYSEWIDDLKEKEEENNLFEGNQYSDEFDQGYDGVPDEDLYYEDDDIY